MFKKKLLLLISVPIILITALTILLMPTKVNAIGTFNHTITLSPSNGIVYPGDTVTVTFGVSNISNFQGTGLIVYQARLQYDSSKLDYSSATVLGSFVATPPLPTSPNGKMLLTHSGLKTSSSVIRYTFKVKSTAPVGNTSISISNPEVSDGEDDMAGNLASPAVLTISQKSTNNNLSALSISNYQIAPAFNASTENYTLTVPHTIASVVVNATAEDSKATISGTGTKSLNYGVNELKIAVTSESGAVKNYKITITREKAPPSNDATLKALKVSDYSLLPVFSSTTLKYSVTVPYTVSSLTITPTKNHSGSTYTISGNSNFKVGKNTVNIVVTAENKTDKKTYVIEVTKMEQSSTISTNNNLKSVVLEGISPKFDKSITNYSATVPVDVEVLDLNAIAEDPLSKIEVSNNNLKIGMNVITVTVTAEDNSKKVYTFNITRISSKNLAYLNNLEVEGSELSPEFNKDIMDYSINVGSNINEVVINTIPEDEGSTITITGDKNLKPGENIITIVVTDKNNFSKTYTIKVYKAEDQIKEEPTSIITFLKDNALYIFIGLVLLIIILVVLLSNKLRKIKNEAKKKEELARIQNEITRQETTTYVEPQNNVGVETYEDKI